jgi:hypothetical protein
MAESCAQTRHAIEALVVVTAAVRAEMGYDEPELIVEAIESVLINDQSVLTV